MRAAGGVAELGCWVMTMMRYGLHGIALAALAAVATGAVGCGGGSSAGSANVAAEWILTENGVSEGPVNS